ncbi:MAG TPA: hypothetical protein ENK57_10220 [Polyangiaceae bacterium]|nr:hypothetical protein [Polyangiaceae bacterium]
MRRKRHRGETKVWHDPLMVPAAARRNGKKAATLEPEGDEPKRRRRRIAPKRTGAKLIAGPVGPADPKEAERERLLHRVLAAEGRPSISNAVDDYVDAGFDFPRMQDVWLQMLEHRDEGRVAMAIERLSDILDDEGEVPKRRAVLESRLRRIEEYADERATQNAAGRLIRLLKDKHAEIL